MQARALEALESLSGRMTWLWLLHSAWFVLLIAALSALAAPVISRLPSRSRYALALAALAIAALGPFLSVPIHFAVAAPQSMRVAATGSSSREPTIGESATVTTMKAAREEVVQPKERRRHLASLIDVVRDHTAFLATAIRPWRPVLAGSWLLGEVLMAFVIVLAVLAMCRLRREATPAPRSIQERAAVLAGRLRLGHVPRVLRHDKLRQPCVCGFIRHAVLLPDLLVAVPRREFIDAILAHELAHARRRDPLVNLAQRLIEALFFFHPGIFWISRWVRREREICTDALAARATGHPLELAGALEYAASLNLMSQKAPVLARPSVAIRPCSFLVFRS